MAMLSYKIIICKEAFGSTSIRKSKKSKKQKVQGKNPLRLFIWCSVVLLMKSFFGLVDRALIYIRNSVERRNFFHNI
jgi:hypothetical protein